MRQIDSTYPVATRVLVLSLAASLLSACGGSDSATSAVTPTPVAPAPVASEPTTTQIYSMTLIAPAAAEHVARPAFHLAPVFIDKPDGTDRREPMSSAALAPRQVPVNPAFARLSTRSLTPDVLRQFQDTGVAPEGAMAQGTAADPLASASNATVYTPAQIRAAYGMFALASSALSVTSTQAAQMGAGQTIYIVDAQHDPNIAAELASFDSNFGLPGCAVTPIATSASLPLSAAPTTGCTFSIVYTDANGAMTATAPAYDSSWATEIAIDVQWAHATAPYARIILIEAANSSSANLIPAIQLANQMGPGVVSQSFGAAEGFWVSSADAPYSTAASMTYVAAAGDAGAGVEWPAASSHVLAVAGTSLTYTGAGPRTETVWSGTGGGVSAYVPTPAYQNLAVPGLGAPANRSVSDVTFNADPYTGQYVAVIAQNSTTVTYWVAGGTSLATPQWAGLIAVTNALRAQTSLAPLGAVQPALYDLGVRTTSYAGAFLDVTTGSDGACATCSAGVGYDLPSGLGSPNVAALIGALSGQTPVATPVITSATVNGKVDVALSFSIAATDAHSLVYSLSGAPAGMSVNASTGVVTWSAPVLGSYSVIANALDSRAGLLGQGLLSVTIAAALPPQVAGGAVSGTAQTPLTFSVQVTDAGIVNYSLSGAPTGMSVTAAGVVTWASPLAGSYLVTVIASDSVTGLSGQGLYAVTIAVPTPPTVPSESLAGTAGTAISWCVNATATNPVSYSLTGAPAGMTIAGTGCITWNTPTAGTFVVTVEAQDNLTGLTGTGVLTLSVVKPGPGITAASFTGVVGKALTGSIAFSDSAASVLSISISGVPAGLSFVVNGNLLNATWASPRTGSYSLQVTVIDSQTLTAAATIPLTITIN